MTLPASESQVPDFGDIHHATMGCISGFKACLSIKPLMKDGWAESRLADLNLWASGVGALARPDMSLDRRLQFQPKPRLVLINLLLTLGEFISSCRTYVLNEAHSSEESTDNKAKSEGTPVSPAESTPELTLGDDLDPSPSSASWFTALVSSAKSGSDTSTESDVGDELDDLQSEVTLKEVMKDIDDILDQLILLGFAIRKSGTIARLRKADTSFKPSENEDLQEHLEHILLNRVAKRQKNGKDNVGSTAKERIQEVIPEQRHLITPEQHHLILANLRRRHRFRYARRHQQKLDQLTAYPPVAKTKPFVQTPEEHQEMTPGLKRAPASNDGKSPPTEDFKSTTPSTAPPQSLQAPAMSATTLSVAEGDIVQMAMPMAAATSRVSVSVATMHYPSPPPISQKMRGFKCPCCYQTLPEMYKNWSRWRKHLVEDLCPYTCPFPECSVPEALYTSRATWRDHVLQSHGAGQNWECLACVGTGIPNKFSSAEEFVSHNRTKHIDAISEDQIAVLQDTCRKIIPPNIAQCPLCPWPQDEEAVPDAVANLEHVGNCIHEFSLIALPWAESLAVDAIDQSNPPLRKKVEEWLKSTCTEEEESADIQKVNIRTFIFFPTQPLPTRQECAYIAEEYFAESSNESSQAERGTLSFDSDLPDARGTSSDAILDTVSEESAMAGADPPLRKLEHDDYSVGWVCALSVEYSAAIELLDERHEHLETAPQDYHSYTLGKIGKHNVVIVGTPLTGRVLSSPAAIAARYMINSFQNVRICLMVGIGGGVPSKNHDIRLGDIVVDAPEDGYGGLLQYAPAKNTQGFLNQPPLALRTAVAGLRAQYDRKGHWIEEIAASVDRHDIFGRPDQLSDRLYQANAIHPDTKESCLLACDPHALIPRLPRDEDGDRLVVHYGLIGSLRRPMRDALLRDRFAAEKGVLSFETEAAGLVDNFPCLVIRGICDYSDSHWNREWQGYAAFVAAAYAKDLLYQIAPSSVTAEGRIKDILSDAYELDHDQHNQQHQAIFDWLTPVDYSPQQHDFISRRQEGTGQWFLRSPEFQTWLKDNGRTLFCPGIPGAGKTIIAAIVIDHLLANFQHDPHTGIAYIYCNFQRQDDQTVEKLLANLLKQLAQRQSSLPKTVQDLYEKYEESRTFPSLHQITAALRSTAAAFEKVFFIIDALDECQNSTKLLNTLFDLQTKARPNVLATSRNNDDIKRRFDGSATVEISAANEDVLAYLNGQLSLRRLDFIDEDIQEKIRDAVLKAAGGSFVSAVSHIDTIMNQPTRERIEEVLQKLNKEMEGPEKFYKQAMERIEGQTDAIRSLAKRALTWITHAKRPLSITEIQHALAVREHMTEFDSDYMPDVKDLKSACVGLVTTDEKSGIIRLVHASAQEFFQQSQEKWFPEGESYITKICLTYLSFSTFDGALCQTDQELEDRLELNPFYGYAACNWGHHARESSITSQEVMNFLESAVKVEASSQVLTAETYKYLLPLPDDNQQKFSTKMTGLHLAAYFGIGRAVDSLLHLRNYPDEKDAYGRTPLSWAAENGHVPVVEQLIATGQVEVDSMDDLSRRPLTWAAKEGHTAIVRLLLDEDAGPNSTDLNARTPLSYAAENGHLETIQLLLTRGAETEVPDYGHPSDKSPLAYAAEEGHIAIVELLLNKGADCNWEDGSGQTPLSYASKNGHLEAVQLLLDRGADTEIWKYVPLSKKSPLAHAAGEGHIAIVELLLNKGADCNWEATTGQTSLSYAAKNGHLETVQLLLDRGAETEVRGRGQLPEKSPLAYAAEEGHIAIVELLLDRGAKIHTGWRSSLRWAIQRGQKAVVQLLLDRGADIDWNDGRGETFVAIAKKEGHIDIAQLLLDRGAKP